MICDACGELMEYVDFNTYYCEGCENTYEDEEFHEEEDEE